MFKINRKRIIENRLKQYGETRGWTWKLKCLQKVYMNYCTVLTLRVYLWTLNDWQEPNCGRLSCSMAQRTSARVHLAMRSITTWKKIELLLKYNTSILWVMLQTFKSDPHPDTFTKAHVLSPLQINFYTKHHSLEHHHVECTMDTQRSCHTCRNLKCIWSKQ